MVIPISGFTGIGEKVKPIYVAYKSTVNELLKKSLVLNPN